jgi:hypothetical protein
VEKKNPSHVSRPIGNLDPAHFDGREKTVRFELGSVEGSSYVESLMRPSVTSVPGFEGLEGRSAA